MNTTIAFYSRTGHTLLIAESLADVLNANLVSIQPPGSRYLGVFSTYVKGGMQATFGIGSLYNLSAPIPPDTDLLVTGTPVWSSNVSPPVRSFLTELRQNFRVALFCTCGVCAARTLSTMRTLVQGSSPIVAESSFLFAPGYSETELVEEARTWAVTLNETINTKEICI